MNKTITQIGDSNEIILDPALLEQANLKAGDRLNVTVDEGGTITLAPEVATIDPGAARSAAGRLIGKNEELFNRLSK